MTLRHTISTGISWDSIALGLVAPLEEREAARFAGYTWSVWETLPREERIEAVAHYRVVRLIEMHQADAVQREQERQARTKGQDGAAW